MHLPATKRPESSNLFDKRSQEVSTCGMGRKISAAWSAISDQRERRKAQNRLSQRKKRQRDTQKHYTESNILQDVNGLENRCHGFSSTFNDTPLDEWLDCDQIDLEISEPSFTFHIPDDHLSFPEPLDPLDSNNQTFDLSLYQPICSNFDSDNDALISTIGPEEIFNWFETRYPDVERAAASSPLSAPGECTSFTPWSSSLVLVDSESLSAADYAFQEHGLAPSPTAPLNERLEFLLSIAQHIGFSSLDEVLLSYYTGRFDTPPAFREAQCRDLSNLLTHPLQTSHQCSGWESDGVQEESDAVEFVHQAVDNHEAE
ncbi:uncharacterized protein LY89DRAFT_59944 [Mollisia scopiformis]|uniref:BZIP domain-containing protein n=1 Tax=Mollisia scopiformis TaxID=149040 RepID=A0A194XD71_MOLSC|nr:uncharacterized protein LY89DRAFT_59944 [Mollisia scopiformis]KUJ17702.1 hypothetical protein LY89DRAFT_59944 [Mollisia scopiformis]